MRLQGCADHTLPGKWDPDDPEMAQETIWGLDLGSGVWISPFSAYRPESERTAEEPHVGGTVWHVHQDGKICGGAVYFDVPELAQDTKAKWTVESWDPLTLSPSVLARSGPGGGECLHGFIRNGRWEGC